MDEKIYPYSVEYAEQNDEVENYIEEIKRNEKCAQAIVKSFADNYDYKRWTPNLSKVRTELLAEYEMERIKIILAKHILGHRNDGRVSKETLVWAKNIIIPDAFLNAATSCESVHIGTINLFIEKYFI